MTFRSPFNLLQVFITTFFGAISFLNAAPYSCRNFYQPLELSSNVVLAVESIVDSLVGEAFGEVEITARQTLKKDLSAAIVHGTISQRKINALAERFIDRSLEKAWLHDQGNKTYKGWLIAELTSKITSAGYHLKENRLKWLPRFSFKSRNDLKVSGSISLWVALSVYFKLYFPIYLPSINPLDLSTEAKSELKNKLPMASPKEAILLIEKHIRWAKPLDFYHVFKRSYENVLLAVFVYSLLTMPDVRQKLGPLDQPLSQLSYSVDYTVTSVFRNETLLRETVKLTIAETQNIDPNDHLAMARVGAHVQKMNFKEIFEFMR